MVLEVGRRRCSRWRQQTDGPLYNTKRSQLCLPLPLTIPTMPCCRLQTPPWKPPERHQWNASSWSLSKYWIHVCVAHFNLSKHTFSRLQNDKSAFKRNCTVEQTCFGRFFLKALMKFFSWIEFHWQTQRISHRQRRRTYHLKSILNFAPCQMTKSNINLFLKGFLSTSHKLIVDAHKFQPVVIDSFLGIFLFR